MKIKQVRWDVSTDSKGRNGLIKTNGIDIVEDQRENVIVLSPVNSHGGVTDSCYIQVDVNKLPDLIAELLKIQEGL